MAAVNRALGTGRLGSALLLWKCSEERWSRRQLGRRRATPSVQLAATCETHTGNAFELVSKEKYLQAKRAASTEYFEVGGGMRCCDLKLGKGNVAERGLLVGVHFEGKRLNGRLLESSWTSGPTPLFIEAGCTPDFPALGEGVLGMKEGGRRELVIPPRMNRAGVEEVTTYTLELITVSSQYGSGYR
eukprot:TRINITY_DN86192_c0_g1_i1.p1 TRINITY_DN86192_c0_g1~~TRINITY_DN86192_c0_g1_i1.p1  ORF type:complete len:187 (+),score=27.87 TRINITY_DN86192_c0_g1_i1:20-580(+)